MNEHIRASPNTFDGDAISRADREFLASLSDHPLTQHPLYGVPCPPRPTSAPSDRTRGARSGSRGVLRDRRRLDAGELRLLQERLHGPQAASFRWSTAKSSRSPACAGCMAALRAHHMRARGRDQDDAPPSTSG